VDGKTLITEDIFNPSAKGPVNYYLEDILPNGWVSVYDVDSFDGDGPHPEYFFLNLKAITVFSLSFT
jgi:hypothetical protein